MGENSRPRAFTGGWAGELVARGASMPHVSSVVTTYRALFTGAHTACLVQGSNQEKIVGARGGGGGGGIRDTEFTRFFASPSLINCPSSTIALSHAQITRNDCVVAAFFSI